MKAYYVVTTVATAKPENPNFAGQVNVARYGKNQHMISNSGSHAEATHTVHKLWQSDLIEYGYTRIADAKKSWIFKNTTDTKYWDYQVFIEEFKIYETCADTVINRKVG